MPESAFTIPFTFCLSFQSTKSLSPSNFPILPLEYQQAIRLAAAAALTTAEVETTS